MQRNTSPDTMKELVNLARLHNYNAIIWSMSDGLRIPSMDKIAKKKGSSEYTTGSWEADDFKDFVKYVKENGMEFVPEMRLLSHQESLFKNRYPDLMYSECDYDPSKPEVYDVVLPIIDAVVSLIKDATGSYPKAFHIGHDEVGGFSPDSKEKCLTGQYKGKPILPAEYFLADVIRLNNHIKSKGMETWMWGDMLVSFEEFPKMQVRDNNDGKLSALHGKEYRDFNLFAKIPADIVIGDWHYHKNISSEYSTALAFAQKGHKVLGATFDDETNIKEFSQYAVNLSNPNVEGMIATLWGYTIKGLEKFNMEKAREIISLSGDEFWNARRLSLNSLSSSSSSSTNSSWLKYFFNFMKF